MFTDHRNNCFGGMGVDKTIPTKRVSKKLLRIAIEASSLDVVRVHVQGEKNVLADARSRAPHDREVARNLPVPLLPIKEFVRQMFWNPTANDAEVARRLKQLKINNPGVLTYLPDDILRKAPFQMPEVLEVDEDLPEDIPRAFEGVAEARKAVLRQRDDDEMMNVCIVSTTALHNGTGPWHPLMMPMQEFGELPEDERTATSVTRVKDVQIGRASCRERV